MDAWMHPEQAAAFLPRLSAGELSLLLRPFRGAEDFLQGKPVCGSSCIWLRAAWIWLSGGSLAVLNGVQAGFMSCLPQLSRAAVTDLLTC